MRFKLKKESALNLTLEGSIGSFNVGTGREGQNSIEVRYFLTHVGLDFSEGHNAALLSNLAPVREIFDLNKLDFDQLMQRDIDDARVSGELIPYLLDSKSADLIKLFPPIIVVVLPTKQNSNYPEKFYPEVFEYNDDRTEEEEEKHILRSGKIGNEIFQFEQPVIDDNLINHDLVRFKLNSQRTKLVIVDGQHRAMALLALYRNLKDEWSDEKRAPFKEYYAEWTHSFIEQFNLKQINLPVMFCTFPGLDENYKGNASLEKAARTIFLTLNKTARKVSNSRNILLDDADLIASFLRSCLSVIKSRDNRSSSSLRIFNIELDQFKDRHKISSPICISGVSHIYYIIEHLMLNKEEDVKGVKPRSGKLASRIDLNMYGTMDRIDGRNLLGAEVASSMTRNYFAKEAEEKLCSSFMNKFGNNIIAVYEKFKPYHIHNLAVFDMEEKIGQFQDRQVKPILFEGQGIGRVFEDHRKNLKDKLNNRAFETDVPAIEAQLKKLDDTAARIETTVSEFKEERSKRYLSEVTDKHKLRFSSDNKYHPKILRFINDLYDNVFTTVAFQAAIICTYYDIFEKTNRTLINEEQNIIDLNSSFLDYIEIINSFFIPNSYAQLKKIVRLFAGDPEGELNEWKIASTKYTFRSVVYQGEMQPDQWPKYKYLILEIWNPEYDYLKQIIKDERGKCRRQIFFDLYENYRNEYARNNAKLKDALTSSENEQVFNDTYNNFKFFLKIIGYSNDQIPTDTVMKQNLSIIPDNNNSDEEVESWESVEE